MSPLQPTTPIPVEGLTALADLAERRLGLPTGDDPADGVPCIVRARSLDDEVEVGWLPLDGRHPVDELLGTTAPEDWSAVGVATSGWAHRRDVDEPGRRGGGPRTVRIRSVHLVGRDGAWSSRWRPVDPDDGDGDVAAGMPGDAGCPLGRIDDVCRRALGVPTHPPAWSTAVLWATQWLDALVELAGTSLSPSRLGWPAVAALHPAVAALRGDTNGEPDITPLELAERANQLTAWRDWPLLRRSCAAGTWSAPVIDPELASWFDDGSFARWLIGGYPDLADLHDVLGDLVPPRVVTAVRTTLVACGLDQR